MNQPDEISLRLDLIARILEAGGLTPEVDYTTATIIVWSDNWPILLELKQRSSSEKNPGTQEEDEDDSLCD